jgi:hypothetical protein
MRQGVLSFRTALKILPFLSPRKRGQAYENTKKAKKEAK